MIVLVGLVVLISTACSSVVSNKNQREVTWHPLVPEEWPQAENGEDALLLMVNPYEKQCCGATPPYSVSLRNLFGDEIFHYDDLLPIDDFFCVALKPGRYTITLRSETSSHNMHFAAKSGEVYYAAADVRLVEPVEMFLYAMEKGQAMHYVSRAAHRIAPEGENPARMARLREQLACDAIN